MPDPWMMLCVPGNQVEVWPKEETACIRSVRKLKIQSKILDGIGNLSNFRKSIEWLIVSKALE